jgi:hypothetical protein
VSTYNRGQWIESFSSQLSLLRPHLTVRVLDAMAASAWVAFGANDEDPIKVARAASAALDASASSGRDSQS